MKHTVLMFCLLFCIAACQHEKDGCMDCNATNFDSTAEKDDGSCVFMHDDRLGEYIVSDSVTTHATPEEGFVEENTYSITIERVECNPSKLVMLGYANYRPTTPFPVEFEINGDSIFIKEQIIEGPDFDYDEDWGNRLTVYAARGWFSGDSIYYQGAFAHHNDYIIHKVWGKKK